MTDAGTIITKWVAPTFGVIIANVMFATPMRAVLKARKEGTLSSLNPVPWPAITGNCAAWIGYSYFKKDWFVYLANQPGFLMGVFYSLTAIALAKKRTRDTLIMMFLALCLVLPTCAVVLNLPLDDVKEEKKSFVWGLLCNLILVLYYSAPLSTLVSVVKTKSSSSLHWPSCLMNLINGTCWVAYGFAIQDYFILSPNAAGMVLSLVQMSLIFIYREGRDPRRNTSTRSFFFPSKSTLGDSVDLGNSVNLETKTGDMPRSNSKQKLFGDKERQSQNHHDNGKDRV